MLSQRQKEILQAFSNNGLSTAMEYEELQQCFPPKTRIWTSLMILKRGGYIIYDRLPNHPPLYFLSDSGRNLARLLDEVETLRGRLAGMNHHD